MRVKVRAEELGRAGLGSRAQELLQALAWNSRPGASGSRNGLRFGTLCGLKSDTSRGPKSARRRQHHLSREVLFTLRRGTRELHPLLVEHKYSDGPRIITAELLCNDRRVSFG